MADKNQKILNEIVAKLQDPILLFSISFGIILLSIGAYSFETIIALRIPLLIVFCFGICGTIAMRMISKKINPNQIPSINNTSIHPENFGIKEILPNRHVTSKALESVTINTKKVKMLAISGLTATLSSTINAKFAPLRNSLIQCLMLSPKSKYVEARQKENPTRTIDGLIKHIEAGLDLLKTTKEQNNLSKFEIRTYDEHPSFRIIIIDDLAYVSFYPRGSADQIKVLVVEKGKSWLYDAFEKYFDTVWERSITYN